MIETRRPAFIDGKPKRLLIDGKHVEALSGETFQSFSPSTDELVAELALAGAEDVDRAVRAARAAFEGPWSRFKPAERQAVLLKLADLVDAEFEDLALLDTIEMGRPITASRGLRGMLQRSLRHFAGAATAIHGQTLSNSFPVDLMINRGIFLDVARHVANGGADPLPPGYEVTAKHLDDTAKAQGVDVRKGDSVLIRTGWGQYFGKDNAKYLGEQSP